MITAEEARKRTINISMLNDLRALIEDSIQRSYKDALYETKIYIGKAIPEYIIDEMSEELRDLGYKVTYTPPYNRLTAEVLDRRSPNIGILNISW